MITMSNKENYLTYKKFNTKEETEEILSVLSDNNIDFIVENATPHFDARFNNDITQEYDLKIKPEDFIVSDSLLANKMANEIKDIPKDYYLYSFSDEELLDIQKKKDEWGIYDIMISRHILKERDVDVSEEALKELSAERLDELKRPEDPKFMWIIVGYIFAMLGGIIGILWGWFLLTHKKTLPNGEVVYGYSRRYQKHGFLIMIIGIFFTILMSLWNLGMLNYLSINHF